MEAWETGNLAAVTVATVVALGGDVALLVVALVVRQRRPAAGSLLVVWSALGLGWSVLGRVLGFAAARLASERGVEALLRVQTLTTVVGVPVSVGLVVLLALALLQLARPDAPPQAS